MAKKSDGELSPAELAAVQQRFRLLDLAAHLENGGEMLQADRDYLASLLKRIAIGQDANAVLIHPSGRVCQASATKVQEAFLAAEAEATVGTSSSTTEAVRKVEKHSGAGLETIRAARKRHGSGIREIPAMVTSDGLAAFEATIHQLTKDIKSKKHKI